MQEANYQLSKHLKKQVPTKIVAYGGNKKWLPLAYPLLMIRAIISCISFKPTVILLGDGVLSPLGWILKKIFKIKVVVIIHGLEIKCNLPFYQFLIPRFIKRMDLLVAVSRYTKQECLRRDITPEKIIVIPNGVDLKKYLSDKTKDELRGLIRKNFSINLKNKKVLLTVGRLKKRKGHQWFIKNVMTKFDNNFIYLIAGVGEEKTKIHKEIKQNNLTDRVFLLGKVSERQKKYLLNVADIFVMPNIQVSGDVEGFGIVALEAASVGLPVIASNIDGIKDALKLISNSCAVNERDNKAFIKAIKKFNQNFSKTVTINKSKLSWEQIAEKYVNKI